MTAARRANRERDRRGHGHGHGRNVGHVRPDQPPVGSRIARFSGRHGHALAAFLAAGHLVLALLTFLPQPHTGGDNAAYITLGRSLLDGQGYVSLYDPATPPHTQYPPVFPAVLAVAMSAGLEGFFGLKVVIALLSAGAVGFSYLWIRRRRRPALALGVASILALSPGVLEQAHWILSDVPFWCFTMVGLWGAERMKPELRGRFIVAVVAIVVAYFTRSAGLPLLVAGFGWLALRRRWKQLALLAATAVPLAFLWWLRSRANGGVDYVSQFWFVNPYDPSLGRIGATDLFDRIVENAGKYVRIHLPILMTGGAGVVAVLIALGTTGLGIYGWARRLRRPTLAELFIPLYIGLLLIWPAVWSGERFLLPALPLILYYAGDGLARIMRRLQPDRAFAAAAAALCVLAVAMAPAGVTAVMVSGECMLEFRTGNRYPCMHPAWREFFDTAEWAERSLPEGEAVLSRKPRLFYVISGGHPGRVYPFSDEPAELFRAAQEAGARYVVLDRLDRLSEVWLEPAIAGRLHAFCVMHTAPSFGTSVLGILPGAQAIPDMPLDSARAGVETCPSEYWRPDALRREMNSR
jgi:hypothetical protein